MIKNLLSLEPNSFQDYIIYAKFTGNESKKVHWYRKNRLYFQIECNYSDNKDHQFVTIFKSHPSKSMNFSPFQLLYNKIRCISDDPKIPLRIRFYDYSEYETTDAIVGECYTDIETLKNSVGCILPIINIKENGDKFKAGSFTVNLFRFSELTPFTEYVKSGLKFSLAVAIDMFYENKLNPTLHKEGELNNYEQVLSSSLEILTSYSSDNKIAAYALGYGYKTKFRICGNLTLNDSELFLHDMNEVLLTYKDSIKKVTFNGYSWFSPLIEKAIELADCNMKNFKTYTIVLIVTCGKIEDEMKTIDSLNKASNVPISFIFINIGNNNEMKWINAKKMPLTGSDSVQTRNCVDYVFYKDIINKKLSLDHEMMKGIPSHVSIWANMMNIKPQYFLS